MIDYTTNPLDSRYHGKTSTVTNHWNDFELTKLKFDIEVKYFFRLCDFILRNNDKLEEAKSYFEAKSFTEYDYNSIKDIEKKTKHDIKSIEIHFRNELKKYVDPDDLEFTHFGLTSQDVVSVSIMKSFMISHKKTSDKLLELFNLIDLKNGENKDNIFIARTHGQLALPTTFAHFFERYYIRLVNVGGLNNTITCKFGGAIGTMNALKFSYDNLDWEGFMDDFVKSYDLTRTDVTTQTDNYSSISDIFSSYSRFCDILIDFNRNIWDHISQNHFKLKVDKDYIGSSTMPQKINPIKFENSEGNFELAKCLFDFYSSKLAKSRGYRDLTDSTVLRSLGIAFGYFYLAIESLIDGINDLEYDSISCIEENESNYQILSEALQHELRKNGMSSSYDEIKNEFIGVKHMDRLGWKNKIASFKDKLNEDSYEKLFNLTISNYIK